MATAFSDTLIKPMVNPKMPISCPLCHTDNPPFYWQDNRRSYRQCQCCQLVFVEPRFHLSPGAEKREYDLHCNSPDDTGYRRFLSRIANPLLERIPPHSHGLDFGCGPGPTLSMMLAEAGHRVDLYDIFYERDEKIWHNRYRFITATEVAEHLSQPGEVLARLWQLLEPGGILGIMTKRVTDCEAFARWHYKNDPTHICFFSEPTFQWLGQQWQASVEFIGTDVVLITKPKSSI